MVIGCLKLLPLCISEGIDESFFENYQSKHEEMDIKERYSDPVKHLRWNFLQK